MIFSAKDIDALQHLYRINLINSCSGYKSANLIGTKSHDNISNVAVFSSVTHFGSHPPIFGFVLRPTTVKRNTYANIKETGSYTINHIHQDILEEAHHTSAKYESHISEFNMTSLEEDYKGDCYAPFVKDCPIQIEMEFIEEHHIKVNNTILILGKIKNIYIKDNLDDDDGFINLSKAKVATINGLDGYAVPELKIRQTYQRPKSTL